MRVMVLIKADEQAEAGVLPNPGYADEMMKFNNNLVKAGVLLASEGLYPSAMGKRVKFSGGKATVIDGPFTESKELIAGFWLWQVKSVEEAVEWVMRIPKPASVNEGQIEIRPVFEMTDFAARLSEKEVR